MRYKYCKKHNKRMRKALPISNQHICSMCMDEDCEKLEKAFKP